MFHVYLVDSDGQPLGLNPKARTYRAHTDAVKVYKTLAGQFAAGRLPASVAEVVLYRDSEIIMSTTVVPDHGIERCISCEAALARLRREHAALLARVEQLTRRVTDLEGNAVYRDEPDIDPPDYAYEAAIVDEEYGASIGLGGAPAGEERGRCGTCGCGPCACPERCACCGAEIRGGINAAGDDDLYCNSCLYLPRCRHCSKPVEGGGNEHEECRITERDLWGPGGRPDFRY